MTLFDWLKEITTNKTSWENFSEKDRESFNTFMINRYLSMNIDYIEIVNFVQKIPLTEKEKYYTLYCQMIPKKNVFLKYIKSNKKTKPQEVVEYVAKYYECSLGEADHYIDIIREPGVRNILWQMGIDQKEQDKLVKTL
jgi:hypothetical protein